DVSNFSKSSIHSLITSRIGIDHFMNQLDKLRKTEDFVRAEQGKAETDLHGEDTSFTYYDYDFTTFFKFSYDQIQRQLKLQLKPTKREKDNKTTTTTTTVNSVN